METNKDIVQWIVRYVQGELDEEGIARLQEWRDASPGHEEMFQRMISRQHFEESWEKSEMTREEMDAEWELIHKKLVKGRKIRFRRVMQYAAVIFVLLCGGGLWYFHGDSGQSGENVISSNEGQIKEIGSKAILVLSDGREFDLQKVVDLKMLQDHQTSLFVDRDTLSYSSENTEASTEWHTLKIPRGGEYVLILGDGSTVYLNAESQLTYPARFSDSERRVRLIGEAYFEVAKDSVKPFIVETEPLQVRVLGTKFGVRAYPDEECIKTTLKEGKVSVAAKTEQRVLIPDMQAVFNKSDECMEVKKVDVNQFIGWKDGRLIFDNCPLEQVLKDLGRWYSFDVIFDREELRTLPFSLNIKKHKVFEEVLELLENTGSVHFEIKENTVVVK